MTSPLNREELRQRFSDYELINETPVGMKMLPEDLKLKLGNLLTEKDIDNLLALADQYAQQVAIEELKGLREATKQMTHVDAHISDASVAQGIRVHTNALLERRIAELEKERGK